MAVQHKCPQHLGINHFVAVRINKKDIASFVVMMRLPFIRELLHQLFGRHIGRMNAAIGKFVLLIDGIDNG